MQPETLPPDLYAGHPTGAGYASRAKDSGDQSLDLSLRLLTALVTIALVGSVGLLAYRWLAPRFFQDNAAPVNAHSNAPAPAPPAVSLDPHEGSQVLMAPGKVFRCEDQGRVSFSDRTCAPQDEHAAPAARAPEARPDAIPVKR